MTLLALVFAFPSLAAEPSDASSGDSWGGGGPALLRNASSGSLVPDDDTGGATEGVSEDAPPPRTERRRRAADEGESEAPPDDAPRKPRRKKVPANDAGLVRPDVVPTPAPPDDGFTFVGLLTTRATATNIVTTNPLLNGQVVGTLGGLNTTSTQETTGRSAEQRLGAFFRYAPPALDGRFALDTAFEIDYGFGDASYGIGGNTGGAFGADQVNLQTRRLAGRYSIAKDVTAVVGLQFVADGASDPATARIDDLVRGGGRLDFFGSEAAGVSIYGTARTRAGSTLGRYRVGAYTLWEQGVGADDDISLLMADGEADLAYATRVGLHAWMLTDTAGGAAGLLGSGPTSALSELQGGPRLGVTATDPAVAPVPNAQVLWLAADAGYNRALDAGRFGVTALAVTNLGIVSGEGMTPIGVQGGLFDVEGRVRWAPGAGSVLRAEALLATSDGPGTDYYTGVLTGNSWGIVGAIQTTHGCYLLFPDPMAVNRQVAAVYDVSNAGRGLMALTASAGWDAVPNRWTIGVGGGHARASDGTVMGTEVNARVVYKPFVLGNLGVHAGTLLGTTLPQDPWVLFTSLDGMVF